MDDLGDLVELRLLAVLATYRHDGTVLLSAVWHQWRDGGFRIVTGSRDVKAAHLRRDPGASIVVCEPSPPCRGVELRCRGQLLTAGAAGAVKRIASGYLGLQAGAGYAGRAGDDLLIRLEPGELRAWDFAAAFDGKQLPGPDGPQAAASAALISRPAPRPAARAAADGDG